LNEGFEIDQSEIVDSEINIEDTHIEVRVFSPTDISLSNVGKYFDEHLVDVEVNLGKLYEMALEVYQKEDEVKFLEEKTIDMMVVYDDIPFSDTRFDCNRLVWQKSEVEDSFRNIVERNLGAMRLKNSNYIKTAEDNDYFEVDLESENDITTTFEYLTSWPFFMDVSPSKGELMIGDDITGSNPDISKYLNLFFCMNNYHFVYDVKYPALISLSDEDGFVFQFANMVVIEKNTPRRYQGEIINYESEGVLGEEFCDNGINNLDVGVWDASNFAGLDKVDVSYSCMSSNCYVGRTNNEGLLSTKFPPCINGKIYADKIGYYFNPEIVSTDEDAKVDLLLEPYYEMDVEIKVVNLENGDVRGLTENEEAIFQLENIDNGFINAIVESGEYDLVSGMYSVTSYLMRKSDNPIKIEGETYVECVDIPRSGLLGVIGFSKEECFETKIEDSEIENFIAGGAKFEFSLGHSELRSGSKLVLYVPYASTPRTNEEMINIINNIDTNKNNQNFKYPTIE
jgi:hypothetical protein